MRKQHSQEYSNYIHSKQWAVKSRWVQDLTDRRCCLIPWLKAQETHHLTYKIVFGWEVPCWHLVPLSKKAHKFVHIPILWQQPVKFFVNIYLRLVFLVLWTSAKPWMAFPFWLLLYFVVVAIDKQITKPNFELMLEIVQRSIVR